MMMVNALDLPKEIWHHIASYGPDNALYRVSKKLNEDLESDIATIKTIYDQLINLQDLYIYKKPLLGDYPKHFMNSLFAAVFKNKSFEIHPSNDNLPDFDCMINLHFGKLKAKILPEDNKTAGFFAYYFTPVTANLVYTHEMPIEKIELATTNHTKNKFFIEKAVKYANIFFGKQNEEKQPPSSSYWFL